MVSAEICFCTHVEIAVLFVIKYPVDGRNRRNGNGSGRKPLELVGIVWRINLFVLVQNPLPGKIAQGKFQGGIGLQGDSLFQAVQI